MINIDEFREMYTDVKITESDVYPCEHQWISINDRSPDDFQEVLFLAINDMGKKEIMKGHHENGNWLHCCLFYLSQRLNNNVIVTHWMPLPSPPEIKDNNV